MPTAHRDSRIYWVALAAVPRIGGRSLTQLLRHFGTIESVFEASAAELMQVRYIGEQAAQAIATVDLERVKADLDQFSAQGVEVITWHDADYPANLLHAPDAPPVLFCRGALSPADTRAVAVVGTRQPAASAHMQAHSIASELAVRGWTIVSGLALGIDTAAHEGALAAAGRTLAVLGSGAMKVYPRQNDPLAGKVIGSGALLCEVYPDAGVSRQALVARNRITSGLSRAVIVVQSRQDGGSMSTARRATAQGRSVYYFEEQGAGVDSLQALGGKPLVSGHVDWDALSDELDAVVIASLPPEPDQPRLF